MTKNDLGLIYLDLKGSPAIGRRGRRGRGELGRGYGEVGARRHLDERAPRHAVRDRAEVPAVTANHGEEPGCDFLLLRLQLRGPRFELLALHVLDEAVADGASLVGANLSSADLTSATIQSTVLSRANLRGAKLAGLYGAEARSNEAIIDDPSIGAVVIVAAVVVALATDLGFPAGKPDRFPR